MGEMVKRFTATTGKGLKGVLNFLRKQLVEAWESAQR